MCTFCTLPRQSYHSPEPYLDVILQAVDNTNSQYLIQQPIDAEINLVNLLEPVLKVNLVHLRTTTKARTTRSNDVVVLVVASENHSASTRHIRSTLNSKQRAAKVQLLQIESAAVFRGDGVVTTAGQVANDAKHGDIGLALRIETLTLEELLRQAEGVVCELLVGADLLSRSGRVAQSDIVKLSSIVSSSCTSSGRTQLTSAMISEL